MALRITASLSRDRVAHGEQVRLTVDVAEDTPATVTAVADPLIDRAMVFDVRLPDGSTRELVVSAQHEVPGVQRPDVRLSVPYNVPRRFTFDLDTYLDLEDSGRYGVVVRYTWREGAVWTSAPLTFEVMPPRIRQLNATPLEATAAGLHTVHWVEREESGDRLLGADLRLRPTLTRMRGAVGLAGVPQDSTPILSVSPPGQPSPDRWLAYVSDQQLWMGRVSSTPESQRTPRVITLATASTGGVPGTSLRVVAPLLAEATVDDSIPECVIGLVRRDADEDVLLPVRIGEHGVTEEYPAVRLAGRVQGAWATWCGADVPALFVAVERAGALVLVILLGRVVSPRGARVVRAFEQQATSPRTGWSCLAGDARTLADGTAVVGVAVARGDTVQRLAVHIAPMPEAPMIGAPLGAPGRVATPASPTWREQEMPSARRAAVRAARVDADGVLHVLLAANDGVQYAPAGPAITWSDYRDIAQSPWFTLTLPGHDGTALGFVDAVRGTRFIYP